MAYIPGAQTNKGNFVGTTSLMDVSQLKETSVTSTEFQELLVRLYQVINNIVLSLNLKESGYYVLEEFVTGAEWFAPSDPRGNTKRQEFRLVMNIGALPPGVTTRAHGLAMQFDPAVASTWMFTEIYGTAALPNVTALLSNYYPIPWASPAPGTTNIALQVNGTNVVITNNSGVSFTSCYVVLKYVKN